MSLTDTPTSVAPRASEPLTGPYTRLLLRGLLAGLIAGFLAGAVAFVVGEPHVDAAIAIEEAASAPAEHTHGSADHGGATADDGTAAHGAVAEEDSGHSHGDDALVSRTGQKFGLFLATTLSGLAIGALFASVLHVARRHSTLPGPALALVAAGLGWLAIEAVPFGKYPANPPAVGNPDTIDQRTLLWLAAVILGIVAVLFAVAVFRTLRVALTPYARGAAAAAVFVLVVVVGYLVLPIVDEVPDDFPATLLWEFRASSLVVQATLWLVLGLAFAVLTERSRRRVPA